MIVSRKIEDAWKNLEGYDSRLSGSCYYLQYLVTDSYHRLYGTTVWRDWDLNDKSFKNFKEV